MGIFRFLFGQEKAATEVLSPQAVFSEIARIASDGDKEAAERFSFCLSDIRKYYAENREKYFERGFDEYDDNDTLYWIGLIDILISTGYVCECDYKVDKSDFVLCIGKLKSVSAHSLFFDEERFKEEGNIIDWCEELDDEWEKYGWCVADMEIDSDSYLLFPCRISDLSTLTDLAKRIGHNIGRAVNM